MRHSDKNSSSLLAGNDLSQLRKRLATLGLTVALAIGACSTGPESDGPRTGVWRAEIDQFGRKLPFTFEVTGSGEVLAVTYLNGEERVAVEAIEYAPETGTLRLAFPSYSSWLEATVDGGRMSGNVFLNRRDQVHRLPFNALHGINYRFFPEPGQEFADLDGRWEIEISMPEFGVTQRGVALLRQDGPYLSGTVMTTVGDYRFLTGEVRGNDMYLSAFDGNGTQLWLGKLGTDGELEGSFDTVTYRQAEWIARRNPDARLEDPTTLTRMQNDHKRLEFTFPNLEGEPVSMSDERFRDKVVLVVVAGSWCPTCHDEALFMAPYYRENRDRGLEVVYLMFEYSDQFADVADQVLAFRDRYGIEHEMLFAGDASRTTRDDLLPMLNGILAFPTTIFVDRSGEVRRIHTAFPGPATGDEHEAYKQELRRFVDELLNEPV